MDLLFQINIKNNFEKLIHLHVFNIMNYTYDFYIHDTLNILTKMELNIAEKVCYR